MVDEGSLRDHLGNLDRQQWRGVHIVLCTIALKKWRAFMPPRRKMRYGESVAGTCQELDGTLPLDAFLSAKKGKDVADVDNRYREPISALVDGDLKLPDGIESAYDAIYNLFRKYALCDEVDDWVIVNQALCSETDASKWLSMLSGAMEQAAEQRSGR